MRLSAEQYRKMQKQSKCEKMPLMSENDWQNQVIGLARALGYRVAHFRAALNQRGKWMTPVQADGAGFVDLVLCSEKQGRVIYAELKREDGKVSPKQQEWIDALTEAGQEVYVWKPSQADEVEMILRGMVKQSLTVGEAPKVRRKRK